MRSDRHQTHYHVFLEGGGSGGGSQAGPSGVKARMLKLVRKRLGEYPSTLSSVVVKQPVGLLFARGDRGGQAAELADQIKASFEYWHMDSAEFFDIIFPGWHKKGKSIAFSINSFLRYRREVERDSSWRYSGETDLLLLNYTFSVAEGSGEFAFDQVINLPVERMLREEKVGSVDFLMSMIVSAAKSCARGDRHRFGVSKMSDHLAIIAAKTTLWRSLKETLLGKFAPVVTNVESFAITDLSKCKQ